MRPTWPLLLALGTAPCSAQQPATIDALLVAGQLDAAEQLARAGGDTTRIALGEVLVTRGRLTAAESLYAVVASVPGPDALQANAALADLAWRRGDHDRAERLALTVADAWRNRRGEWRAGDHLAAGRALRLLGSGDPAAVRDALAAFDASTAADAGDVRGALAAADLLLERYNAPDAEAGYRAVLAQHPDDPRALVGVARVMAFNSSGDPMPLIVQALAANPVSVPAHLLRARLFLEAEHYDSARVAAEAALRADSTWLDAWAAVGALAWVADDSAGFRAIESRVAALNPQPAEFYAAIAEAAGRHRRYADAVDIARRAVALDPQSVPALGALGTNLLRTGQMTEGRQVLAQAFARDPYHLWHKNTLDLLDQLAGFETITTGKFTIVASPRSATLLAATLGPLLEESYEALAVRYGYRPPTPIRLELYDRHADFSVRTIGLAGLGALGVSFGPVLVLDGPEARDPGSFNLGSTAWHELAHTFTLGASDNRVPRWVSEGLSVLEERRARPGWGARANVPFVQALAGGDLLPIARLNDGFVRPDGPNRIGLSYYQASLVMEFLEERFGIAAIRAMLRGYAAGRGTAEVLQAIQPGSSDSLDVLFTGWLHQRFATPLAAMRSGDATVIGVPMAAAAAAFRGGDTAAAVTALRSARERFPELGDEGGPGVPLARVLWQRGDRDRALAELAGVTGGDETALDANRLEAAWRIEIGDTAAALAALERASWVALTDGDLWRRRAELATASGRHVEAIAARRVIVALAPSDPLAARTDLAAALLAGGEAALARRELLLVLEQAPSYERAQELLLQARSP